MQHAKGKQGGWGNLRFSRQGPCPEVNAEHHFIHLETKSNLEVLAPQGMHLPARRLIGVVGNEGRLGGSATSGTTLVDPTGGLRVRLGPLNELLLSLRDVLVLSLPRLEVCTTKKFTREYFKT